MQNRIISCILSLYYVDLLIEEALYMKKIVLLIASLILMMLISTAAFAAGQISVTIVPAGAGSVPAAGTYADNGPHDFTAVPNPGYEFEKWIIESGDHFSNPASFDTDRNRDIKAIFKIKQYTISAEAYPASGGSVYPDSRTVDYNENVPITATANPGFVFKYWKYNDTVISSNASELFTAYDNRHVVAWFEPEESGEEHTIAVTIKPEGAGTVIGAGKYIYNPGNKTKQVVAVPNSGYTFSHWEEGGNNISSNASELFDINRERNLVAVFVSSNPGPDPVDPKPDPVPPDPVKPDPLPPGPDPIPKPPYPYKEFKITYHPGVYGTGSAVTDTAYPGIGWLRGTTFTRPGYIQAGWSWDPYGKEFNAALNAPMPMLYENITVYPYWEPIKGPLVLTVGYSGSGAIQVNGRYVYNGESFTIRPGESLTFGFYPASGNYVYSVLLAGRYREYPGYGFTVSYDMMQNRNQTLAVRFESVYTRPKTGDDSNIALWAALGICSAVCLGVLLIAKKKKK